MLTRENAIASIIAADPVQNFPVMASSDVELLINQIYDDFEEQMKAKDEEIERLKKVIKDLNTEIEDYEQFSETIASARG